jgi:hypothetical protein
VVSSSIRAEASARIGVAIAWLRVDASRTSEVAHVPSLEAPAAVGDFVRQRPGHNEARPALPATGPLLLARVAGEELHVRAAPERGLRVDGVSMSDARVGPGAVLSVPDEAVFVVVRRPPILPPLRSFPAAHAPSFGAPDSFGFVGESPDVWRVRDVVAGAARAPAHVFVFGPSGAGKGLIARMVHALSPRSGGPLVVCSDGQLAAAEDLLARASGGTLVVDPAEALSPEAQGRLLHFARTQRVDSLAAHGSALMQVRIVVLARKLDDTFHEELRSRFLPIAVPGFERRREDVPLLARARALSMADVMPELAARFVVPSADPRDRGVRLDGELVEAMVRRAWTTGGFQMDRLLFRAFHESPGDTLTLPAELSSAAPAAAPAPAETAAHLRSGIPFVLGRLGLPAPRTWGELRIRPVDGLTVLLTVRTRSARCTHAELGLASAKSRGPTKAWELLIATCEGRGTFNWRQFGETRDTARKQVERLSKSLGEAFGLPEPPFQPFDTKQGWVAKFLAVPER